MRRWWDLHLTPLSAEAVWAAYTGPRHPDYESGALSQLSYIAVFCAPQMVTAPANSASILRSRTQMYSSQLQQDSMERNPQRGTKGGQDP